MTRSLRDTLSCAKLEIVEPDRSVTNWPTRVPPSLCSGLILQCIPIFNATRTALFALQPKICALFDCNLMDPWIIRIGVAGLFHGEVNDSDCTISIRAEIDSLAIVNDGFPYRFHICEDDDMHAGLSHPKANSSYSEAQFTTPRTC